MAIPTDRPFLKPGDKVRLNERFPAEKPRGTVGTVVKVTGHAVTVELVSGVLLLCMDYQVEKVSASEG